MLSLFCDPQYIPDSYEYGLIAQCFLGESQSIDCQQAELAFRPPMASIFSGMLFWMTPFLSISVVSLMALASSLCALVRLFAPLGKNVGMGAATCVLGAFIFSRYPLLSDARIICLAPLLWAWAWLLDEKKSSWAWAFAAGLAVGISALTRPECQLGVIGILLYALWYNRSRLIPIGIGAAIPMATWIIILSVRAKRLVIGPRFWEDHLLEFWTLTPKRIALQTYGMGIYSPPARLAAIESPALTGSTTMGPDINSGIGWLSMHALDDTIIWLTSCGIVLTLLYIGGRSRKVAIASILLISISAAAAFWPQARDPIFIQSNIAILKIIFWAICGAGLTLGLGRVSFFQQTATSWILLPFCIGVALLSPETQAPKTIESQPHGVAARNWIKSNTPPNATISSSFETAPIVWLSQRQWQQTPSLWEDTETDYIVLSDLEAYWHPDNVTPMAFFAEDASWIAIVKPKGNP